MEDLPCKGCGGMCCGPVPVTKQELKAIKKKIKSMPLKKRQALESQPRFHGTCIFYDQDNDRCGIHSARPAVCRAFGYYKNLKCFRNTAAAADRSWVPAGERAGILSQDFTWRDF